MITDTMKVFRVFVKAIQDEQGTGLNPIEYSKFKFGCKQMARHYGYDLAVAFIDMLERFPIDKQIVVCSSPYCFIPTATFAMKDYFIQRLNVFLVAQGLPVVQETKIHRTITYKEDYGGLTADERMKLIQNDDFHIDTEFIKDKHLLFLDDIRITGSHERVIERMYQNYGLTNSHHFLYYAVLANPDIHPNIENRLNYAFVKSLLDLDKIIKNEDFLLNTRTVKYMLNAPFEDFVPFINYQRHSLAQTVYHSAIGNSYHLIEDYATNFNYLKKLLNQ